MVVAVIRAKKVREKQVPMRKRAGGALRTLGDAECSWSASSSACSFEVGVASIELMATKDGGGEEREEEWVLYEEVVAAVEEEEEEEAVRRPAPGRRLVDDLLLFLHRPGSKRGRGREDGER